MKIIVRLGACVKKLGPPRSAAVPAAKEAGKMPALPLRPNFLTQALRLAMRPAGALGLLLGIGLLYCCTPGSDNDEPTLFGPGQDSMPPDVLAASHIIIAFSDSGMHFMSPDVANLMVLPPLSAMRTQVIARGILPTILSDGVTVEYSVPGNSTSITKSDFWSFEDALFGFTLPDDVGLYGKGLTGALDPTAENYWEARGIPLTPLLDDLTRDNLPLAALAAYQGGVEIARTRAVLPVSGEIQCNLCHQAGGGQPWQVDVLERHDSEAGTNLMASRPVKCGRCHEQFILGALAPGGGLPSLSRVIHSTHANRVNAVFPSVVSSPCYACHPGDQTPFQRDVHAGAGLTCVSCHGGMAAVGDPGRLPWRSLPLCSDCHVRAGFQFEEPGKLFKDSRGHNGVRCAACHNTQHAIAPSIYAADNAQAIRLQGFAGTITDCRVCHTSIPGLDFRHAP